MSLDIKQYNLTPEKLDVLWEARDILREVYAPRKYEDDVESYACSAARCLTSLFDMFPKEFK